MKNEFEIFLNNSELMQKVLHIQELDNLIHLNFPNQNFQINYLITKNSDNNYSFNVRSKDNLIENCGIFKKLLTECKLITFRQKLNFIDNKYFINFVLYLRFSTSKLNSNGLQVGEFKFENNSWTQI